MSIDFSRFKVAAAQVSPVYMDVEASVEKACKIVDEAAKQGAKIVGFPECFVPGFPSWVYAASPNHDTAKAFEECVKNSVSVPSKLTDTLCEVARRNEINVVIGLVEQDAEYESALYITQLFIGDDGRILGKHRKIVPTYAEKLLFASGDGSTLSVFKTRYGELGGLNCGEHYNPLARFALIAQNIKIHVASWPMPGGQFRDTILPCVMAYAHEGCIFVINVSAVVTKEIREKLLEYAKAAQQTYEPILKTGGGVGAIISPHGRILAQADPDKEEIIYADCSMSEHYSEKVSHDIVGNYNRPEIFNLTINRKIFRLVTNLEDNFYQLLNAIPKETLEKIEKRAEAERKTPQQIIMDILKAS